MIPNFVSLASIQRFSIEPILNHFLSTRNNLILFTWQPHHRLNVNNISMKLLKMNPVFGNSLNQSHSCSEHPIKSKLIENTEDSYYC